MSTHSLQSPMRNMVLLEEWVSCELSAEEQGTHHKNTKDLKYTGLNVAIIMAFFASKKPKPTPYFRATVI
jgi:hypothetical protein